MKLSMLSVSTCVLWAITGCSFHNSTHNEGFDFPIENVKQIVTGKTTGDELVKIFGGPLEKSPVSENPVSENPVSENPVSENPVSENEEKWEYYYSSGTETAAKYFLTDDTQSTSHHKTLEILLKNGTVTSFTYAESSEPVPALTSTSSARRKKNRSSGNSSKPPLML